MLRSRWIATACVAVLASTGCYHAVIDTGETPGPQVIDQPWAMSFAFGLVPPPPVDASTCPSGVARVVTEHSFLNGLVAGLTFGIITPMHLTVTCAAGEELDDLTVPASREAALEALNRDGAFLAPLT